MSFRRAPVIRSIIPIAVFAHTFGAHAFTMRSSEATQAPPGSAIHAGRFTVETPTLICLETLPSGVGLASGLAMRVGRADAHPRSGRGVVIRARNLRGAPAKYSIRAGLMLRELKLSAQLG
jgi:hypothetical protein